MIAASTDPHYCNRLMGPSGFVYYGAGRHSGDSHLTFYYLKLKRLVSNRQLSRVFSFYDLKVVYGYVRACWVRVFLGIGGDRVRKLLAIEFWKACSQLGEVILCYDLGLLLIFGLNFEFKNLEIAWINETINYCLFSCIRHLKWSQIAIV